MLNITHPFIIMVFAILIVLLFSCKLSTLLSGNVFTMDNIKKFDYLIKEMVTLSTLQHKQ